jgi:hypothetical protein
MRLANRLNRDGKSDADRDTDAEVVHCDPQNDSDR